MAPDLGPDARVCGAPDDWFSTDEQFATLVGCEVYEGSLILSLLPIDLSLLSSLRIVRRHVTASDSISLEALEGIDNFEWVGSFRLSYTRTRDFSALRNLAGVEDYFELIALQNLESIQGLERLQNVGGGVRIQSNPVLTDLDGLSGLESIGGDLDISYNETLESLDGLTALREVGGNVTIRLNPQLTPAAVEAFLAGIEIGGVVNLD